MIALLSALALAWPAHDPREAAVSFDGGDGRGRFTHGSTGLSFTAAEPGDLEYWLSATSLTDGAIRATVVLGKKPDFTLLFRASQAGGNEWALDAEGVSVEQDDLVLYRWAEGGARELGQRISVPQLRARRAIELVVQLSGPVATVTAWDADTLALLGTLSTSDGALPTGRVGWRVHPSQGPDTVLAALTVLDDGSQPREAVPTELGPVRYVEVGLGDRERIPADLGAEVVVDDPDRLIVKTDPTGLERLRALGLSLPWESADEPFWVRDARYRAAREDPGAVARDGIHLDLSYKSPEMVEDLLIAMARRHPDIAKVAELGKTWQGRPILGVRVSDHPATDEDEPVVLLVAAHHGGELLSTEYALDALWTVLEHQDDPRIARWVSELELWFVPLVNPDGCWTYLERSTDSDRKNGRDLDGDGDREPWEGVDLNRNYPFAWGELKERGSSSIPASGKYRGPSPASEPETKAIVRLADLRSPVAVLSWHTAANKLLTPYTVDGRTPPTPDAARPLAEAMSAAAGNQASGRPLAVAHDLYPVDGTDQDWHRWAHGSLAYIAEGSHHNPLDPEVAAASVRTMRPVFETLLDQVLDGPRLVVQVHDAAGHPVSAVVRLDELKLSEGETWRSRASDGRFDLMLAADGRVTVHVTADGYRPFEKRVTVDGVTEVVAELQPLKGG